jgi:hypothetical protein
MELAHAGKRSTGMTMKRRGMLSVFAVLLLPAIAMGCTDKDDDPGSTMNIRVEADIVANGAPFAVEVTQPTNGGQGWSPYGFVHEVRVTSNADETVRIDDARFAHEVREGDGTLVTAGRGCGAGWDESTASISIACQDDLQIIRLEPNETHPYPVTIYPEVGPERLRPGTYVIEETIPWWFVGDDPFDTGGDPEGEFTVRLTYTVEGR